MIFLHLAPKFGEQWHGILPDLASLDEHENALKHVTHALQLEPSNASYQSTRRELEEIVATSYN